MLRLPHMKLKSLLNASGWYVALTSLGRSCTHFILFYFLFYKFKTALCAWTSGILLAFYVFGSMLFLWLLCMNEIIDHWFVWFHFFIWTATADTYNTWVMKLLMSAISLILMTRWEFQPNNYNMSKAHSWSNHNIAFVHYTLLGINLVKICGFLHSFSLGIFVFCCWNRRTMHYFG